MFIAKKYKHKIMNLKLCKMCMYNEELPGKKKEKKGIKYENPSLVIVSGPGNHHHKSIAVLRCITVYDTIPMDSLQLQLELCICIDKHNGRDFDFTPITVRSSIV